MFAARSTILPMPFGLAVAACISPKTTTTITG